MSVVFGALLLAALVVAQSSAQCTPEGSIIVSSAADELTIQVALDCGSTVQTDSWVCSVTTGSCSEASISLAVDGFGEALTFTNTSSGEEYNATCIGGNCLDSISYDGTYFLEVNGFKYYEGSQYTFPGQSGTFVDAISVCEDLNANVPSVTSRLENAFIFDLHPVNFAPRWLGATINHNPFYIEWVDGTPVTDFLPDPAYIGCDPDVDCLYQAGEPNNLGGDEFCLSQGHPLKQVQNHRGWNDAACDEDYFIVCEKPVVCKSIELGIPEGVSNLNCPDNAEIGSSCYVTCGEGYTPSYPTFMVCGEDGLFSGFPTCNPVTCGTTITTLDPNASSMCMDQEFMQTCTATCNDGYQQVLGTSGLFTCNSLGDWVGDLECAPVDCGNVLPGALTDPNLVSIMCTGDTTFGGDNCVVECADGYAQTNGEFVCGADGFWTGDAVVCTELFCDASDLPVDNAEASFDCLPGTHGLNCDFTCADGFVPAPQTSGAAVCSNGEWITNLECLRDIPCDRTDLLGTIPIGASLNCDASVPTSQTCEAECPEGFDAFRLDGTIWTLVDVVVNVCLEGVWDSAQLNCVPKQCGGVIFGLDQNASADCLSVSGFFQGPPCIATCNDGFTSASGNGIFNCNAQGFWEGSLVCEAVA